jgi:hypothetical protein
MDCTIPHVSSEYAAKNYMGQQDKKQAEEYPANQKFPYVIGIEA